MRKADSGSLENTVYIAPYNAVASPPVGELLVRGDNLFSQYWGREQATREAFDEGGWFRTGDSAEVVPVPEHLVEDLSIGHVSEPLYRILGRTR